MTTYLTETWDSLADGGGDLNNAGGSSAGWWDQNGTEGNRPVIVSDFYRGASGKSLKFTIPERTQANLDECYPPSQGGTGTEPADPDADVTGVHCGHVRYWFDHNFGSGDTIHVRFYAYWSANFLFRPGGSGSKFLYLNSYDTKGSNSNWRVRFAYQNINGTISSRTDTTPTGTEGARFSTDDYPVDSDHHEANQPSPTTLFGGQWYAIEFGMIINTPGVANGRLRWWIDGVLQGDYPNENIREDGPDGGGSLDGGQPITSFSFDQYFGGASNSVGTHPEQYVWIDDVVAADGYIGLDGGGGSSPILTLRPTIMM